MGGKLHRPDPRPLPAGTVVCRDDAVAEREARGFDLSPDAPCKVIVTRWKGRLYGWLDSCPHYLGGTPMAWRRDAYLDASREYLSCHAHGALFEIETGECVIGPCLGQRLKQVPLRTWEGGQVVLAEQLDWGVISE